MLEDLVNELRELLKKGIFGPLSTEVEIDGVFYKVTVVALGTEDQEG